MRRSLPLYSKIVGRADDAFAEMVFPNAIGDDTREKWTGAAIDTRHPIGKRNSRVQRRHGWRGRCGSRRGIATPQHLQVPGLGFPLFVVHLASAQEEHVLSSRNRRIDLSQIWPRRRSQVIADGMEDLRGVG